MNTHTCVHAYNRDSSTPNLSNLRTWRSEETERAPGAIHADMTEQYCFKLEHAPGALNLKNILTFHPLDRVQQVWCSQTLPNCELDLFELNIGVNLL